MKIDIINDLKIEKLVYQGFGLGFHDSNPIFVYNAVPGDVLKVKVLYRKKKALYAEIEEVIKPAETRIEPSCEVYGKCGGCDWLNIDYRSQLIYKNQVIREIFRKFPAELFKSIKGSDVFNHYRNKSFMPVSKQGKEPVFGIYAKKTHSVVPHSSCKLHPAIFDILGRMVLEHIKKANVKIYNELSRKGDLKHIGFRYSFATDEVLVILVTRTARLAFTRQLVQLLLKSYPDIVGVIQNINPLPVNRILGHKTKILYGKSWLEDAVGEIKFRINYDSFFQVNSFTMKNLYDYIKAQVKAGSRVLDAYSGIGSIALYIAAKAEQVVAVEENRAAVKDGEFNAQLNQIGNVKFLTGKVEHLLDEISKNENIDTVIFDPPRKGLDKSIIKIIADSKINRIIYVSCNPATQLRDVELLLEEGFALDEICPFDMFPHTYHIENVIIMERK